MSTASDRLLRLRCAPEPIMPPPAPLPLAPAPESGVATGEIPRVAPPAISAVVAGEAPQVEGISGRDGPEPNAPPAKLVIPAGLKPLAGRLATSNDLIIGKAPGKKVPGKEQASRGACDDFRLYNRALCQEEIARIGPLGDPWDSIAKQSCQDGKDE